MQSLGALVTNSQPKLSGSQPDEDQDEVETVQAAETRSIALDVIIGSVVRMFDTEGTFDMTIISKHWQNTVHSNRQCLVLGGEAITEIQGAIRPSRFYDLHAAKCGVDAADIYGTEALRTFITMANVLTYVDLSGCPACNDNLLAVLAPKMASRAFLNISGCTAVTQAGLSCIKHSGDIVVKSDMCWRLHSPNASQTAREVVEMQVLSLRVSAENDEGVRKCFEYASPGNKAHTGPAERFGEMIRRGYSIMMQWADYSIDVSPVRYHVQRQNQVYKVYFNRSMTMSSGSFYWSVSKQQNGCWMTDSVMPA
jgi:hypothetical protein